MTFTGLAMFVCGLPIEFALLIIKYQHALAISPVAPSYSSLNDPK